MSKLIFAGYTAEVNWDEEAKIYHGEITGIKDVITFQADTFDALIGAMKDSIEDYKAFCKARGEEPAKPKGRRL